MKHKMTPEDKVKAIRVTKEDLTKYARTQFDIASDKTYNWEAWGDA